jgi:hypothetical protein
MIRFWWLLLMCVIVWYSTVTIYVAIRGAIDVKQMFRRLGERDEAGRNGLP